MTETPQRPEPQPERPSPRGLAREVFHAELEEGGDSALSRAGRFVGGVLTSALGGSGSDVVGASVVVRRREDEEEVLRIDVPDAASGDQVLQTIREDLEVYPIDEFVHEWVERTGHGRHSADGRHPGTRLE